MFEDLFEYKDLYEACTEAFAFGKIVFKKDFGPYKAGEEVGFLWFDLTQGVVIEYSEDGLTEIKRFPFYLTA